MIKYGYRIWLNNKKCFNYASLPCAEIYKWNTETGLEETMYDLFIQGIPGDTIEKIKESAMVIVDDLNSGCIIIKGE